MEWTTEPPSEPGWYWIFGHYMTPTDSFAVLVIRDAESNWETRTTVPFENYLLPTTDDEFKGVLWFGPIQPPHP